MSVSNLPFKLRNMQLPSSDQTFNIPGIGRLLGFGTTVGNGVEGWAPSAVFHDYDAATGAQFWINVGTITTASWKAITSLDAANTWAALQTFAAGLTVSSSQTLAVTTADKLTVGGVIVPQTMVVAVPLIPIAAVATRELFYAQTDGWTVTGIVTCMSVAEGTGSVVGTICKVTGNNVAVGATTPMITAAIAMTTTAGTPVVSTLTSTGADLVLAATNKIGIIFSGGDSVLDTGLGMVYIKMKRS